MIYLIFSVISFSFFIISLKNSKKAFLLLVLIFPFSFFAKIGTKSIMLTEILILIYCLTYIINRLYSKNTLQILLNKKLLFVYFFLVSTIFISVLHQDLLDLSIYLLRISLFTVLLTITYSLYNDNKIVLKSFNYLSKGYLVFSIILFFELLFFNLSFSPFNNISWKIWLQNFYLYPLSVPLEQLASWSAVSGLSGFFVLHHTLAIYLAIIFILSNFVFPIYKIKYRNYISITSLVFLYYTNSRTALIALISSFVIYFLLYQKLKIKYFATLFCIISLIAILLLINNENILRIKEVYEALYFAIQNFDNISLDNISSFSYDGSTLTRFFYDVNSLSLIKDNLFLGVGVLSGENSSIYKPHSTLLIQLQMFGILPITFLTLFLINIFLRKQKPFYRNKFLLIFLLFMVISSFGTNIISDLRNLFPIIICFALILHVSKLSNKILT